MGFRYRKSLRIARGMRLNLTGRGVSSFSVGRPGSTLNFGQKGVRGTVGIPGSGLSYSSRLSSGPGMLLGLIIAFLTSIFILAARGNRFAQVALLALVVGGAIFILTQQTSGPVFPVSIGEIKTDTQTIDGTRSSVTTQPIDPTLENSASQELRSPGKFGGGNGRVEPYETPKPLRKSTAQRDAQTTIVERTPPNSFGSGSLLLPGDWTSNGRQSPGALLNLSNAADALRVQQRLMSLGYFVGRPDGAWGQQSQFALSEFRKKNNLSAIAPWDEETQTALFSGPNNESGSDLEVGHREMPVKAPLSSPNSIQQ